ncbi:MAG TPA: DUF3891 family protein, partial [Planctomycetaceae bacterium]|nr:DUF3891 family protein [Planctomycetaceae bacterium]
EVASLGDRKKYEIWESGDRMVSVEPWPFVTESFDVSVEVRTIHQLSFTTDRELESCLRVCPVEQRTWNFGK